MTKKLPLTVTSIAASTSDSVTSSNGFAANPARRRVDDDVEPSELGDRALDESPRGTRSGEVAVAAPGGENVPPLGLERRDDAGAELARAAGDERPDCARAAQRACSNRFATASQLTTFHHAAR